MPKGLRIVFMGTPGFAVASLRRLVVAGYDIAAVVTAPDKPAGRGLQLRRSAVKEYALSVGLPVLQPEKLKDPEFVAQFKALDADLGIVIAFRMLPEVIWSAPRLGTFNLHASLLPQYRGAAPINWALINGEKVTGVTTFMLNHEIDKGDILMRREVAITERDDACTLHDKLMEVGSELVVESVKRIEQGGYTPESQLHYDEAVLKPAPKLNKENCRIDFSRSCEQVRNLVRGLSPYPGAWCRMGEGQLKIYEVSAGAERSGGPGTGSSGIRADSGSRIDCIATPLPAPGTLMADGRASLKVACADGYLRIEDLQPEGKRRMSALEFLCGMRGIEGMVLE